LTTTASRHSTPPPSHIRTSNGWGTPSSARSGCSSSGACRRCTSSGGRRVGFKDDGNDMIHHTCPAWSSARTALAWLREIRYGYDCMYYIDHDSFRLSDLSVFSSSPSLDSVEVSATE
jgi:hypothetical protein